MFHTAGIDEPDIPAIFAAGGVSPPTKGALEAWRASERNRQYIQMPEPVFAGFIDGLRIKVQENDKVRQAVENALMTADRASLPAVLVTELKRNLLDM